MEHGLVNWTQFQWFRIWMTLTGFSPHLDRLFEPIVPWHLGWLRIAWEKDTISTIFFVVIWCKLRLGSSDFILASQIKDSMHKKHNEWLWQWKMTKQQHKKIKKMSLTMKQFIKMAPYQNSPELDGRWHISYGDDKCCKLPFFNFQCFTSR